MTEWAVSVGAVGQGGGRELGAGGEVLLHGAGAEQRAIQPSSTVDSDTPDVVVGGETNKDAAWFYPNLKEEAREIENRIAFWKGVEIID